jgi:hypothetical protein
MNGYSVTISECSKDLSAKEKVMLKDTKDAIKFDEATQDGELIINPELWAVLSIHNENSADKDYDNYMIVDMDGKKYVTGSSSFWNAFNDIISEMADSDEEWGIKVYRVASKNYVGKDFLTCSIV